MEQLKRVENKVDRIEERLILFEEFFSNLIAIVRRINARTAEITKLDKVHSSLLMLSFYNLILATSSTKSLDHTLTSNKSTFICR